MSNNKNDTDIYYAERQKRSAFQPSDNTDYQQAQVVPALPLTTNTHAILTPDRPSLAEQQGVASSTNLQANTMQSDGQVLVPSASVNGTKSEPPPVNSFAYDLNKYKYDYFISNLHCSFDREYGKFGSPTGICTLDDDRLLVANFDQDSLLLLDIQGTVHHIYRNIQTPKDVLYYSSNPYQALIATKKEVVLLDLVTSQVVVRSKTKGFYPWNVQYIKEHGTIAACDPSGERIVYFDENLAEIGVWSLNDRGDSLPAGYQKIYPYAACFFPDNTSLVLTSRDSKCQLRLYDIAAARLKSDLNVSPLVQSYSIYGDSRKQCLIADKGNDRLLSITLDSIIAEYKSKSIREPYSMTFLSTGTLCVSTWNKSYGSNGGIAVISEEDININQ